MLRGIFVLLLLSSISEADNCISWSVNNTINGNSEAMFYCSGINLDSTTATWFVANGNYANNTNESLVGYCSSATDTTCLLANRPGHINSGDWVYVKNNSAGATDYFKAQFVDTVGFQNAQAHNPAPAPTAVPLSPLSKLLLALLFMGASLMMLRKKGAKV